MRRTSCSDRLRVLLCLWFVAAATAPQCLSQAFSYPDHPRFTSLRFGEQFGISVVTVTSMAQDADGFLWIGTQTGLFRYDGSRVTRISAVEPFVGHYIHLVIAAPDHSLWVSGMSGVARYQNDGFVGVPMPATAGTITSSAQNVAVDQQGTVFIATDRGLARASLRDPSLNHFFGKSDGVDCKSEAVVAATDGSVWFTCGSHLAHLAPGAQRPEWDTMLHLPQERIVALVFDGAGNFWLRSARHVDRIDRAHHKLICDDAEIAPANQEGGKPTVDRDGDLLVPSMAGLYWRDGGSWRVINDKDGLSSNNVQVALQDVEGTLWVGGYGTGLDHLTGIRDWSAWTRAEGLPDNATWATLRDHSGRLWVATAKGVSIWETDEHRWKTLTAVDGLSGTETRQLELARDGSVWAIALPGGITRIDSHTLKTQRFTSVSGESFIHELASANGDIWATTTKRLFRFDGSNPSPHPVEVPLPNSIKGDVWYLEFSPGGVLWVCGIGRLWRFDGQSWRLFTRQDGLLGESITSMAALSDDEIWIGYDDVVGITRFHLENGQPHTERFPWDLSIIGKDSKHRVWLNGTDGIRVVALEGGMDRFSQAEGLIWDDISPAGFREEKDGSFLIATTRGLAHYIPHARENAPSAPRVLITEISLGDQNELPGTHPERDYKHANFHAQFSPLVLTNSSAITCRYRLAGLEESYTESSLREVQYSSLAPGDYEFSVQCRNDLSAWTPQAARFSFTILPAWWQALWFRGGCGVLALVAMWLVVRIRTHSLNRRRRQLEEAVAQRSAELIQKNHELEEISLTDPLTRARNRRYFYETIPADAAHVLRQFRGFAAGETPVRPDIELVFAMVDIDFFKVANDEHGHMAGDRLIQEIARRLSELIRKSDVLVRWGGEEFLIVCRSTDREHAALLCSRILEAINATPYSLNNGASVTLTCSVGWAPYPWIREAVDALTLEQVIDIADRALYIAKKTGRNQGIGLVPSPSAVRAPYEINIEDLRNGDSCMANVIRTANPFSPSKTHAASAGSSPTTQPSH